MENDVSLNSSRVVVASLVAPTYAGGLAGYSRLLATGLNSLGYGGVFSSVYDKHAILPFAVSANWPVYRLASPYWWRSLWRPLLSRLASRPWTHFILPRLVRFALRVPQVFVEKKSPKAIHFVGTGWDLVGFGLLRVARRLKCTFSVWPAVHPGAWGDDRVDVRLYQYADKVFCQSDHERGHLVRLGVPEKNLVSCGLPPMCKSNGSSARLRSSLQLNDRPTVLFLGRRDDGKGYVALLRAWPSVVRESPRAVLLVAGPGDPHAALLARIPVGNVRDLGIPDEDLKADALAACDVFCLPSAHESFGIVYVEAWFYGKPVICGTAPACREMIEDGKTGCWADQSPETLTRKIVELIADPRKARDLGENGQFLQRKTYNVEAMIGAHCEAWRLSPNTNIE